MRLRKSRERWGAVERAGERPVLSAGPAPRAPGATAAAGKGIRSISPPADTPLSGVYQTELRPQTEKTVI